MQINFPERGEVLYARGSDERVRFITAPLQAEFALAAGPLAISIGQPYALRDQGGTELLYRLHEVYLPCDAPARGRGELISISHFEPNVISTVEHDAKISVAIDTAFEAGRQVAAQEADEAEVERIEALADAIDYFDEPADVVITFADGDEFIIEGALGVIEEDGNLAVINADDQFVGINPSWRGFTVAEIAEDDDVELCPVEEAVATADDSAAKGEAADCDCGVCEAAREDVSPTAGFVPTHLVFMVR
ncbi:MULTISPECIES: hypothetical protein [unclassified Ensifer]|uniref:hypothetical protein n=1 Tax=unclassified Ensifer TaxID=2633371 RepID=UPI000813CF82|nr:MULTISPECIES: hypothetical protein [unclassified Ensifer]OCP21929.1 hypothetical protein BC361_25510 [Ensifer sp. LC54]OCP23291.1 hypothetical protein BC363_25255 [Ensifer sp. LC384]